MSVIVVVVVSRDSPPCLNLLIQVQEDDKECSREWLLHTELDQKTKYSVAGHIFGSLNPFPYDKL